ncbi:hypothetical protein GC096_03750 [Paenibacillus sp. LMG 31461]|uniref:Uncharacterized protein n=1 Tax=Paenibacillus plantarum TaxID=2654975 RepID=A0ABX1X428_9BACL|nr:hypothetical protein [Paenibacillus plantarum]NOU63160.1 hypothetical protein [Paenibacillus plantarum]
MQVLISFEKDGNGNYVVCFKKQSIIVLPGAFKKVTGVIEQSLFGTIYVDYNSFPSLGFIKEPIVNITQEKKVEDMTVDEIWSVLDREGIQIHSA